MSSTSSPYSLYPTKDEIPVEFLPGNPINQREYLIGGELLIWHGPVKEVMSPVMIRSEDGSLHPFVLGSIPQLTPEESLVAVDAAERAYHFGLGEWPSLPALHRIEVVERFMQGMVQQREEVVRLLMWEIGKSLTDSRKEFDRTVDYIRATIQTLKGMVQESGKFISQEGIIAQIRHSPVGVALCMGPFNYPLNETFTTLIPALLMGNTVVFKPAKYGVLFIQPLLKVFQEVFPPGVINIIYGSGANTAGALMATGKVDLFAFIGTQKGGNEIKRLHPKPNRLRSALGLDAKNPGIILPDADLAVAVKECLSGALSFNGQRCTALKILWVHRSIVDDFLKAFSHAVDSLHIGMPWDKGVEITPMPEPGKVEAMQALVEDALAKGAHIVNAKGGKLLGPTLYAPTVLYPATHEMELYTVEQFGPVVPVIPFDNIEEPLDYCVRSHYGQQASIFGRDSKLTARLIDLLMNQVSRVNLNSQCQRGPDIFPFNGRKDSAEGTLSVSDALFAFSIRTLVAAKENADNKSLISQIMRENASNYMNRETIF